MTTAAAPKAASATVHWASFHTCRHVLEAEARAVEEGDLLGASAAGLLPRDDLGEGRVHRFARDGPHGKRVVEVPDFRALLEAVHDDRRAREQGRVDLLLVVVVRADGGNESTWAHLVRA